MSDLFAEVSLIQQIASVERELHIRNRVYPRWVAEGRMKEDTCRHELAAMAAVLETLRTLERRGTA
jgi:hypothetical protein